MTTAAKTYRVNITKSRSGHHTLTVRSTEHPDLYVRREKLGHIEQARAQVPEAVAALQERVAHRAATTPAPVAVEAPAAPVQAPAVPVLTALEQRTLDAAIVSSAGNGHDFGFVESVVKALRDLKPQAVGALVTSLQRKGYMEVHEPLTTDSGTWTQFVLSDEVIALAEAAR